MSDGAVVSAVVAAVSLAFAAWAESRRRNAEQLAGLLGDKQTVAFGAWTLFRHGFPRRRQAYRTRLIQAVLHACLMNSSDRARGLLLATIDRYRDVYQQELESELKAILAAYKRLDGLGLTCDQLDLHRVTRRLSAVARVLRMDLKPEDLPSPCSLPPALRGS